MRDSLPKRPYKRECGLINLEDMSQLGSHWTCYYKNMNDIRYFDSFGNLRPPVEVIQYLGDKLTYNYQRVQKFNTYNCGHLCLNFLIHTDFFKLNKIKN